MKLHDVTGDWPVITLYTTEQAVEDGQLVPTFVNRWPELTGGRPIYRTASIAEALSDAAEIEIWNEYVHWVRYVMPKLQDEDRLFETRMNGERIWVIDDGTCVTIMRPEEY